MKLSLYVIAREKNDAYVISSVLYIFYIVLHIDDLNPTKGSSEVFFIINSLLYDLTVTKNYCLLSETSAYNLFDTLLFYFLCERQKRL